MKRYGMVIDLNRCVGCQTCTIACKHANDTPPGVQWRKVIDVEQGSYPDVSRIFMVTGCQHCAEPPCVPVCPTGATRQREDGLVTMDYDTCIGCASCAVACPYQARTIVHEKEGYYGEQTAQEKATTHEDRYGVANKCTFCIERIDSAAARGLVPGKDPEVTAACAVACITQAITFGDFNDETSKVAALAKDHRSFQMHAELGTDPQVKYLYDIPHSTPGRAADAADRDDEVLANPANPLVGKRQTFWDYRAAMNFMLGGLASGLALVGWLAHLRGMLGVGALRSVYLAAALIMAVGLFFVFLKIGRKKRFLYVLLRPHSSWMTRETWCVAAFYPSVAAGYVWPSAAAFAVSGLAAAGFLFCQARILYASKGIPAWRAPLVPWMVVASGAYEGLGFLTLAVALAHGPARAYATVGLLLAVLNAGLWWCYRSSAKAKGIGPLSRHDLAAVSTPLQVIGHAAPALLFALAIAPTQLSGLLAAVAGVGAVAGGALWKFVLVTRACHQQGFALPMVPQRGSGRRAAPGRFSALKNA